MPWWRLPLDGRGKKLEKITPLLPHITLSLHSWAVGAVTAKFYKSPVSSQEPSSREASKEKSPDKVESVVRDLDRVNIQRDTAAKVDAKKEDWDINDGEGWGDAEDQSENKISDGWDDDEDWGSLEDSKPESKQSQSLSSNHDWEGGLNKGVKTHGAFAEPKASNAGSGWDDWGNTSTSTEDNKDDARKRREEKRLERQKEIEAKRSAKKGPMKLGGKKMID